MPDRRRIRARPVAAALCAALLLCSCASYDGRGLAPGRSSGADVEALMGTPAMKLSRPDGSSVLYFTRSPQGRHTYAVTLGADGVLRGIDQRLTLDNINALTVGKTTAREARELFGPPYPYTVTTIARLDREVWEYNWQDFDDKRVLWLHFSSDGVLREVINTHDFSVDEPSGSGDMP